MFRSLFFKLLHSPFLYVGIIGVFGLCLISENNLWGGIDVMMDMHILLEVEGYRKAFVIFAAIPFAANFADEWNSKTITNCVTRKSALTYAVSNISVCFISAFLSVFIPLIVFAAVSSCSKTFFAGIYAWGAYGEFADMGLPFLSLVCFFFAFSLSCAMWAVTGMTLTAFFPSKYVALGSPFVLCYAIEQITSNLLPYQFNLMGLATSNIDFPLARAIAHIVFIFGGLSMLCGIIFVERVERKVRNELG